MGGVAIRRGHYGGQDSGSNALARHLLNSNLLDRFAFDRMYLERVGIGPRVYTREDGGGG